VWNVSHQIDIANIDMTVRGSAGGTVLDARTLSQFFRVTQRGILRLHGPLTLTNGAYKAIVVIGRSELFARGVAFTKCDGRLVYASDARVEVLDCNFTENVASGVTGGVSASVGAFACVYSCTPYSSAADDEDMHVLSITGSQFERNAAATSYVVRSYVGTRFCAPVLLTDLGCVL
jgi:hypothetical protein